MVEFAGNSWHDLTPFFDSLLSGFKVLPCRRARNEAPGGEELADLR
jgi:hypothetical protein